MLAHEKLHRHHRLARPGHRVDILHPVHLHEQPLQAAGDLLLHLLRAGARHADEHIRQRHHDLRVLLARREDQRRGPGRQHDDDEEDGEVPGEEHLHHLRGESLVFFLGLAHGDTWVYF